MELLLRGKHVLTNATLREKGVLNDYLENNLFDWAVMPPFDPELTAALGVVRHVRSGCTTGSS